MRSGIIRILTTLTVIAACGWPIWQGFGLVRYAMAKSTREAVRPWFAVPGISFSARQYALTSVDFDDEKAIRQRRDEIAGILAVRPLSSFYWLQFAEARMGTHEAPAKTFEALELSAVTGPNEGYMITQRGLFGIWQWKVLSPEAKSRAIKELVELQPSDGKLAWLRAELADEPEQVRQEIHIALQAQGFSPSNLSRIGF